MEVLLFTSFTNFTSSAVLELFCLTVLQAGQTHVVLLVFGIRLRFMQGKWKNLPFLQPSL